MAWALLMVCALAGCSTSKTPPDRLEIDIDTLVSRPVSRDEIIQKLGPPSVSLEEGAILTYRVAKMPEYPGCYVVARDPIDPMSERYENYGDEVFEAHDPWNEYSLVLVFDSQGLLENHSCVEVYKKYDDF